MLTAIAALVCFASPQDAQASALVSKMLQYYADAKTLTGTITYRATDGSGQVQVLTTLAYEKPSKLYIRQQKTGGRPMQWLITSDGKQFSYDAPPDLPGVTLSNGPPKRLVENVRQAIMDPSTNKAAMSDFDIGRIYGVGATGLGDRSVPLDIAIGRREDLQHDVLEWMTVESNGKTTVNGVEANSIVGKWKPYGDYYVRDPNFPPGTFEMAITDSGKLLRYIVRRYVAESKDNVAALVESWDVNLEMNGKPDAALFKVVP